jgi:type I restriction enzyme S subunit
MKIDHPDWPLVRLGDIAEVTAGQSAPQGAEYFGGRHRFIRVSHIDAQSHAIAGFDLITDEAVTEQKLRQFPAGVLLMPKSGASVRLEKRAILPFDAFVVSHLAVLLPDSSRVDGDFLYFALRVARFADAKAEGYPTLKISEIRDKMIPLPSIGEQRAMAQVLRTVQRAREQTMQVVMAVDSLKRSFQGHLFGDSAWPKVRLGDEVTLQRGYDLPANARTVGNVPVVSSAGISGYHTKGKASGPGVVIGRYGTLGAVPSSTPAHIGRSIRRCL